MGEPLRRRARARLIGGATRAAGLLPDPAIAGVLSIAGRLAARSRYGAQTRDNLALALEGETTPEERGELARGVFRHSTRLAREWLRLARIEPKGAESEGGAWIDRVVALDPSIGILEEVLARGRGAIVVTAHLGNWELLAARLRRMGLDGAVVGKHKRKDSSADWLVGMRRSYGLETLPQDSLPRDLLRVLQNGGVLGVLADLEVRRLDGVFVPFFGRPALTMTAPAALARAHRTPLVPIRCTANPGVAPGSGEGEYVLRADEPLAFDHDGAKAASTLDLLLRMNRRFEAWIRETPEQWAWHQPRWRTRPGEIATVPLPERQRRVRERAQERDG